MQGRGHRAARWCGRAEDLQTVVAQGSKPVRGRAAALVRKGRTAPSGSDRWGPRRNARASAAVARRGCARVRARLWSLAYAPAAPGYRQAGCRAADGCSP